MEMIRKCLSWNYYFRDRTVRKFETNVCISTLLLKWTKRALEKWMSSGKTKTGRHATFLQVFLSSAWQLAGAPTAPASRFLHRGPLLFGHPSSSDGLNT